MKRLLRIGILVLIVGILFATNDGLKSLFSPQTVRAFGDLTVNFHVPAGNPIFNVTNMKPGDSENRNVDVTNGGTVARLVSVKGVRAGGVGADPKLETVLDIVITDGVTSLYGSGSATGPKKLSDFFADSGTTNGVQLNTVGVGGHKTYNFLVTFPTGAGNEFQAKSVIFDLTFGEIKGDNLVINEVYYRVDSKHGLDSPKDRGIISNNGKNVTITISGNGAGSKNTVTVSQSTACNILQTNVLGASINVNSSSSTGKNSSSNNTNSVNIVTSGNSSSSVHVNVGGSTNISTVNCGNMLGQNDEWVEIYNPTDHSISLKNWSLTDNSGIQTVIHANKSVLAGGFALLSKSASTWKFWSTNGATIVELGSDIGDGLDNNGDHLILKNPSNVEVDRMSWGTDTTGFTPPAINPIVPLGDSTGRIVPGFDTDMVTDWMDTHPPTPGS